MSETTGTSESYYSEDSSEISVKSEKKEKNNSNRTSEKNIYIFSIICGISFSIGIGIISIIIIIVLNSMNKNSSDNIIVVHQGNSTNSLIFLKIDEINPTIELSILDEEIICTIRCNKCATLEDVNAVCHCFDEVYLCYGICKDPLERVCLGDNCTWDGFNCEVAELNKS